MDEIIRVTKIEQEGQTWIGVEVPYRQDYIEKIKQITGRQWNQPLKCWQLPYSKEAYGQLKALFPLRVVEDGKPAERAAAPVTLPAGEAPQPVVRVTFAGKKIILQLPKQETDIRFLRSLKYSRWDPVSFCWLVTTSPINKELIRAYFGARLQEVDPEKPTASPPGPSNENGNRTSGAKTPMPAPYPAVKPDTLLIVHYMSGRARLIFRFTPSLVALIKTFPYTQWDNHNKWWSVAYSELILAQLTTYCRQHGWQLEQKQDERSALRKERPKPALLAHHREVPESFVARMPLKRYSHRTIKSYRTMFREFINYYPTRPIDEITEQEILAYLRYLVQERAVSASYQNQAINAIKFYYEQVLHGNRKLYYVERPEKAQALPVVMSEQEVQAVLNHVINLKHKCILLVLYSAGLRVGELLTLRLGDVDANRMQIHVKAAKGKKDRITVLSTKTWQYLQEYLTLLQPVQYLFEGAPGKPYSLSSVQNIYQRGLPESGNSEKSYASHAKAQLRHPFTGKRHRPSLHPKPAWA